MFARRDRVPRLMKGVPSPHCGPDARSGPVQALDVVLCADTFMDEDGNEPRDKIEAHL